MATVEDDSQIYTGIVSSIVKQGCETEFDLWVQKISNAAQQFEGNLGVHILRPASNADPEYVVVFKFSGYANLTRWLNSETRQKLLEESKPLLQKEAQAQIHSGMESLFTPPEKNGRHGPPRYKMAILLWVAVSSLIMVVPPLLKALLERFDLPQPVLNMITAAIMVWLISYYVLPFLTKIFAKWLMA